MDGPSVSETPNGNNASSDIGGAGISDASNLEGHQRNPVEKFRNESQILSKASRDLLPV